jgi:hypothetical protein
MWAMTSYYNPVRYKRRLANYRIFRELLRIPLVTVELSFDGHFQLTDKDADILIQISGGAVLWQKERLLNLAIKSVPPNENNIAWVDCDAVFERPDWMDEANKQLKSFNVVQLFSDQVDLRPEDHQTNFDYHATPPSGHGIISLVSGNKFRQSDVVPTSDRNRRSFAWGLAWAARREILEEHGLYDAMIAGGGTRALVSAMYADFDKVIEAAQFNAAQREHYLKWALPYQQAVGERVGHVTGRLYHLWHGNIENRNYAGRHRGLVECNFNPDTDIAIGSNGAWQWARSKPDLEKFLTTFFITRAEDG